MDNLYIYIPLYQTYYGKLSASRYYLKFYMQRLICAKKQMQVPNCVELCTASGSCFHPLVTTAWTEMYTYVKSIPLGSWYLTNQILALGL